MKKLNLLSPLMGNMNLIHATTSLALMAWLNDLHPREEVTCTQLFPPVCFARQQADFRCVCPRRN